jgi:diguanylate cyclase (GGDEF)-like protein
MDYELPTNWLQTLQTLDIAFQPIINIHTGEIFAVEALLRNYQKAGFDSIFDVFDKAYDDRILYLFDLELRKKAFSKYKTIHNYTKIKLFYNLDNRLFDCPNSANGNTQNILNKLEVSKENIYFEISERHEIADTRSMKKVLHHYKNENFSIVLDDFGVGFSGYKLLYESTPDMIKIDRFFLQNVEKNNKKKMMLRSIANLATQLGIKIVAEGIETQDELLLCKEIGCHFAQGYLIQRPTTDSLEICTHYLHIQEIVQKSKRNQSNLSALEKFLDKITPLNVETTMEEVIEYFKKNALSSIIPIVNSHNEPLGILHENKIKEILYSPYGISILANKESSKSKLKNLLHFCGTLDLNTQTSAILELFSNTQEMYGIIITCNSKYYGFLSTQAIINLVNEENLIIARDQNPLTKLPGNKMIESYIQNHVKNPVHQVLCYFDLDNFKAFNDVYGFRNGDRVIQFFSTSMQKRLSNEFFIGHIGGDDFFCAKESSLDHFEKTLSSIHELMSNFEEEVQEFYSPEDRIKGFIQSKDREGNEKTFPLLTVSASILVLDKQTKNRSFDAISNILSAQKKVAKQQISHLSISSLL